MQSSDDTREAGVKLETKPSGQRPRLVISVMPEAGHHPLDCMAHITLTHDGHTVKTVNTPCYCVGIILIDDNIVYLLSPTVIETEPHEVSFEHTGRREAVKETIIVHSVTH